MRTSWNRALVTGASSGIGRALALSLAARGVDLVLVARDAARLEDLAEQCSSGTRIRAEVLAADLTDAEQRTTVEDRLGADPAIDLLVNNAGFGTFGPFGELDVDREVEEVELNVVALLRLTRAILPHLLDRGRGSIVNVSSLASLQPGPRNATYAATKAFVTSFTESLHEELRPTPVTVTAVLPGFTRTEFQERAGLGDTAGMPDFVWQSPEDCAAAALDGAAAGKALVVPGLVNKAMAGITSPLPRGAKRRIVGVMSGRFGE